MINITDNDPNIKKTFKKKGKKYSKKTTKKYKTASKFNKSYKKLKAVIVDLINSAFNINSSKKNKRGRPIKFDVNKKVIIILLVLYKGFTWESASYCAGCDESTIRKFYNKIIDLGIIDSALDIFQKMYNKKRRFSNLHIDSTSILNKNNSLIAEYYHKMKSKKQIKISSIVDENKIPLSFVVSRGAEADVNVVPALINNLNVDALRKNVFICGDKGYITKNSQYIFNGQTRKWRKVTNPSVKKLNKENGIKVTLITPKRKNQKTENTVFEKKKLSKRHLVENSFCRQKRSFKRIEPLYDRKIEVIKAFYKLAICHTICDIVLA